MEVALGWTFCRNLRPTDVPALACGRRSIHLEAMTRRFPGVDKIRRDDTRGFSRCRFSEIGAWSPVLLCGCRGGRDGNKGCATKKPRLLRKIGLLAHVWDHWALRRSHSCYDDGGLKLFVQSCSQWAHSWRLLGQTSAQLHHGLEESPDSA